MNGISKETLQYMLGLMEEDLSTLRYRLDSAKRQGDAGRAAELSRIEVMTEMRITEVQGAIACLPN